MREPPSVDALGLPPALASAVDARSGLILVGAEPDAGADCVMAALVAHAATARPRHVVSIESPIAWHVPHRGGMVVQRELGTDIRPAPDAMEKALRMALRSGADLIALCELTEVRAIDQALVAAESSALIIAAVPARGVVGSLARVGQLVGAARIGAVAAALSRCVRAVVSPIRLAGSAGKDVWAHDLLLAHRLAQRAIAAGEWDSVEHLMAHGDATWVRRRDDDLLRFVRGGEVTPDDALDAALDPTSLARAIESRVGGTS